MKATVKEQIIELINNMTQSELVELNNTYAQSCNMYDSEIFSNDEEFFSMFYPNAGDGLKVAQAVFYGDYNYSHDWVAFNGYGNLQSYGYITTDELCELVPTIAEYIEENPNDFSSLINIDELQETEE
jgi:hypothetical protein